MGKTYITFKGKNYRPRKDDQKQKPAKTKFFGFTSGNHSDNHSSLVVDEDGNIDRVHETRAPIKGKDFIKYGYPSGGYPKHIYQAKKKGYDIN